MVRSLILLLGLLVIPAVAQAPSIICPVHNVPAQITGRTEKDGEGRTIAWEYCHGTPPNQHCFWTHDQY
jgi:hypothetical protein